MSARGTAKVPSGNGDAWNEKAPDDLSSLEGNETTAVKAVGGLRIWARQRLTEERASGAPNSRVIDTLLDVLNRVRGL
jgi:hypothetical protein